MTTKEFPRKLLHPKYWGSWLLVGVFFLLRWTTVNFRFKLGKWIGNKIYQKNAKRRAIVKTNIGLCFPDLSEQALEARVIEHFQAYAFGMLEYCQIFFGNWDKIQKETVITGREKVDEAIDRGENVIFMTAHTVLLDFLTIGLGPHYNLFTFYKPFNNPVFDWLIYRARLRYAYPLFPRDVGLKPTIREIKPGKQLVFVIDEDHGKKTSVFANFFAAPKATLTTPGRVAKMTKSICFATMAFYDERTQNYHISIGEPFEFDAKAPAGSFETVMNHEFEKMVAVYPAQYLWVLKLFRTQPDTDEKRY
jgi:lauroyl/myristoyl acyltransferase